MKKRFLILVLFLSLLTGCNKISGSWGTFGIEEDITGYLYSNKTGECKIDPFDTSMLVKYFFNDKNNNNDEIRDNVIKIYSDEVIRLHKIFDRHHYYFNEDGSMITNLKVLNDSYGSDEEVIVPVELYDLIKYSLSTYDMTLGMFNIFTGSLTDYWEEKFSAANNFEDIDTFDPYFNVEACNTLEAIVKSIPNTKEEYLAQLTLNETNHSIKFNKLNESVIRPIISVGGVAKGYATDLVKQKLLEASYTDGILFSGGSSLASLSKPIYSNKSNGQLIQVLNPNKFNTPAFDLSVSEEFNFSTSGNYTTNKSYRFLDNDGNLVYRHHIINPFTGYPMSYYRSVSILSYDLSGADMDVLSTTFMNLEISKGMEIRESFLNSNKSIELAYLMPNLDDLNSKELKLYATENLPYFNVLEGVTRVYEK